MKAIKTILYKMFKDDVDNFINSKKAEIKSLTDKLDSQIRLFELQNKFIDEIFEKNSSNKIVGTGKNKIGKKCLIVLNEICNKISIVPILGNNMNSISTIYYEITPQSYLRNSTTETKIKIIDFLTIPSERNKGYGGLALEYLIKYAKEIKAKEIYGGLSSVDEEDENNKLRRNHLYKKEGFSISDRRISLLI